MYEDSDSYELGITPVLSLVTPGLTLSEMETVDNLSASLGREILASKAPADFKQSYAAFYREWQAFRAANSGWFSRGSSTVYIKVLEFKERLGDFQKRFRALGFTSVTETPRGAGTQKVVPWRTIAIFAGVGIGSILVLRAFLAHRSE